MPETTEAESKPAAKPLPEFMEIGSYGPICGRVNAFLCAFLTYAVDSDSVDGFIPDDVYGEKSSAAMKSYQYLHVLSEDGGCGPETRAELKDDDFDFDVVATSCEGTTIFVQPDGSKIAWSLEIGAVLVTKPQESSSQLAVPPVPEGFERPPVDELIKS